MTRWLDRTLLESPLYYALCLSEKDFKQELRRLKLPKDEWPVFTKGDDYARVHFFERRDAEDDSPMECAIVCLPYKPKRDVISVYSLICHEAVHIWQRIKEVLEENEPSQEMEAYAIQNLVHSLMVSYRDQTKRKR